MTRKGKQTSVGRCSLLEKYGKKGCESDFIANLQAVLLSAACANAKSDRLLADEKKSAATIAKCEMIP